MYGGDCAQWENWEAWDQTIKDNLRDMVLASMDALQVRCTCLDIYINYSLIPIELVLLDMEGRQLVRDGQG